MLPLHKERHTIWKADCQEQADLSPPRFVRTSFPSHARVIRDIRARIVDAR